jgi:hypothetical protein
MNRVCLGPVESGNPPVLFPIDGTIGVDYVRRLLSTSVRSLVRTRTAGIRIICLARNEPIGRRGIYNLALFGRDEGEVLEIL